MSTRALFLDRGLGETRGVVTLDGRPERLLIRRDGEAGALVAGTRAVARVGKIQRAINAAFLTLPGGEEAFLTLTPETPKLAEGQAIVVEIRAEARRGKSAVARFIEIGQGAPRIVEAGPTLEDELRFFARDADIIEGEAARRFADLAESEALEVVHALPGGGSIAIEPTRALVAIDVDLGDRAGSENKSATRAANLAALAAGARLLRLKGLGGLVVFDLAGRGHDGAAVLAAGRAAFQPDNPGVAIGPISRFGTMEFTVPRRRAPVLETLCDEDGVLSARTLAQRLVRLLERQGRADPGARLLAACSPAVHDAFQPLAPLVSDRLGARFSVQPRPEWPRERLEVSSQ